jgi:predicted MFS family arabinose efflux permease
MVGTALCFCLAAVFGFLTPWLLLALTFALGMGSAMTVPVWPATYPEVVPHDELPAAVSLGAVSLSLSRVVGPAIGGALVAWGGPDVSLGALVIMASLSWLLILSWRRTPPPRPAKRESFQGALRSGLRFARDEPGFRAVLLRSLAFVLFANAGTALLPLIARQELQGTPQTYGVLWACNGIGGLLATALLPRLRARFGRDALVLGGSVAFAAALLGLSTLRSLVTLAPVMVLSGGAGLVVMSSLQLTALTVLPEWVQARGMALFLVTIMGGMACGSALWGAIARAGGVSMALYVAAGGALLAAVAARRFDVNGPEIGAEGAETRPSLHWPKPVPAVKAHPHGGHRW